MENTTKKKGRYWKTIAVMAMFIVFPAISWYYLQTGATYQMHSRNELKDYGKSGKVSLIIAEENRKIDLLQGKVHVIYRFESAGTPFSTLDQKVYDVYWKLFSQFSDRPDDFRLVVVTSGETDAIEHKVKSMQRGNDFIWAFSRADGNWNSILSNAYDRYLIERGVPKSQGYIALADTLGTIRNFYNPENEKEINRMVEHIAIMLPVK